MLKLGSDGFTSRGSILPSGQRIETEARVSSVQKKETRLSD
jgi:hypothetical protein